MKLLLLSHIADIDGVTPVLLTKFCLKEFDYLLLQPSEITTIWESLRQENRLSSYDRIYITDLGIPYDMALKIENDPILKKKVRLIDHHHGNLFLNEFSFAKVVDERDGKKECAATLYFAELSAHHPEAFPNSIDLYLELVRKLDTWLWQEEGEFRAKQLGDLFDIYGITKYLSVFYDRLNQGPFAFTKEELLLLESEAIKKERYFKEKADHIFHGTLKEYRVGVVMAEQYRSELGNFLATVYQDTYDFIAVIGPDQSVSLRGIKALDLGELAKQFGGNGHQKASGFPIPFLNQKQFLESLFQGSLKIEKTEEKKSINLSERMVTVHTD